MFLALLITLAVALFLGFVLHVALMGPRTRNLKFRTRDPQPAPARGNSGFLVNVVLSGGEPRSRPSGT
ncbi:hypothetical protein ACN3XK_45970 [Actinomadura welshii]